MERLEAGDRAVAGVEEVVAERDDVVIAVLFVSLRFRPVPIDKAVLSIEGYGPGGKAGVLLSRSRLLRCLIKLSGSFWLCSGGLSFGSIERISSRV